VENLHSTWLLDQQLAYCATRLSDLFTERNEREAKHFAKWLREGVTDDAVGALSDATLALVESTCPLGEPALCAELFDSIGAAQSLAKHELDLRESTDAKKARLPAVQVAHAVYLLRQPHLSMLNFAKWLHRSGSGANLGPWVARLATDAPLAARLDHELMRIRDKNGQTRDRVDAVDALHAGVAAIFREADGEMPLGLTRIWLALRNSLFCRPLMLAGGSPGHGISLPFGVYLSRDDEEKVYFKYVLSRKSEETAPRFVPRRSRPGYTEGSGMEGSLLRWDQAWGNAFRTGARCAKELWRTQNGRLRAADAQAAGETLRASVVVDVRPACEIVDSVLGPLATGDVAKDEHILGYMLDGRSAEAYWAQVILGLLLPGGDMPFGVVTGQIEEADGAFEIHPVAGVLQKLQYAQRAGFSRVILSGADVGETQLEGASRNPALARQQEDEVGAFLEQVRSRGARKNVELNRCSTARAAADAMQPSGWRRTTFMRLPATQKEFSTHLRRLFLLSQTEQKARRESEARQPVERDPWMPSESEAMRALDDRFLSGQHAVKFVRRDALRDIETQLGKWLAWKDHQVRTGDESGIRGPGLGILALRTAHGDNEMRIWSSVADHLSASPAWWDEFQWSDRDGAARLLARLLRNRRANPAIGSAPAPDLLVIFDDGNLTQSRTNRIFPDDFRGQLLDLLNPRRDDWGADDPLTRELLDGGELPPPELMTTRIIVIHGPAPDLPVAGLPAEVDEAEFALLKRVSVFRFGFSVQAAFAMANFDRKRDDGVDWVAAVSMLDELARKRVLSRTRGTYFVRRELLASLRDDSYCDDAKAHLHAARALTPIIEPRGVFTGANRDRALEPEPVLEATWHLQRVRALLPPRGGGTRNHGRAALAALTLLRPYPDWDTVKLMQVSTGTARDAVELGSELLQSELRFTEPHTSRVAAYLNAIGTVASHVSEELRDSLVEVAHAKLEAVQSLFATSRQDHRRQMRKFFSEYLYCMGRLGVPEGDDRTAGPAAYLQKTVDEVLRLGDLARDDNVLDDFPLSRDWLRMMWEDDKLDIRRRSTHAYVAALVNVGRWSGGEMTREPWDVPWVEYFALTTASDFAPAQLHRPLTTWQRVYGHDEAQAQAFGERVRNISSYRPKKRDLQISDWAASILAASENLWEFLNLDGDARLAGGAAEAALGFVRVLAAGETIPAFEFLRSRPLWQWPRRLDDPRSPAGQRFAADVVGSHAGWVTLLASIANFDRDDCQLAISWLRALGQVAPPSLAFLDPEKLVGQPATVLRIADEYRRCRTMAVWNGYQLLGMTRREGWVIDGEARSILQQVLQELDAGVNSWFFALAGAKASPNAVAGAHLMLSQPSLTLPPLDNLQAVRDSVSRRLPYWVRCASEDQRPVFLKLQQLLGSGPPA